MKRFLFALTTLLLLLGLVACGSAAGGEPSANELVDAKPEPTADPAAPVNSDDPVAGDADEAPTGEVISGQAGVNAIQILILESFPVQVRVQVTGMLPDGCTTVGPIDVTREGDAFVVTVPTTRPADMMCTQVVTEFEESVPLDVAGLPAGTYAVNVNGVTDTFTLAMDNVLPGAEGGLNSDLPPAELAELVQLSLERALVAGEIPDLQLLLDYAADRDGAIYLSTENLPPGLTPELPDMNLVLLSPEALQARADAEGDFPALRFQEITSLGPDLVRVSLGNGWIRAADSDMFYLSGGGFTIEFARTGSGWEGEITTAWIS